MWEDNLNSAVFFAFTFCMCYKMLCLHTQNMSMKDLGPVCNDGRQWEFMYSLLRAKNEEI
jgi:hypothetical protein